MIAFASFPGGTIRWLNLALASNAALSAESCERLRALATQYAAVELTSAQEQIQA